MLINRKEVKQIANLAKLSVSENEIDTIMTSLNSVVEMINHINESDTESVKLMANPIDAVQRFRVDDVTETSNKETLLNMATESDEDYYLVPTVVE